MTYCVAIRVDTGLVFVSDSRTNAGVDNVGTYSKMYSFDLNNDFGNERHISIMSAGNLATTQGVVGQVKKDIRDAVPRNLITLSSIEDIADYVGEINIIQQGKPKKGDANYEASFIVGGEISGQKPAAYLVYPQGNHITTSKDTSFLQIGESKYGKPILDRIISPEVSLETAALCALVSMDTTIRSNLTVGPPIDLILVERNIANIRRYRFEEDSEYLRNLHNVWEGRIKEAFNGMPPLVWEQWEQSGGEPA